MSKKIIGIIVAVMLVFTIVMTVTVVALFSSIGTGNLTSAHTADNVIETGQTGYGITWSINSYYELTITGSGDAMEDYAEGKAPWYSYADKIVSVYIEDTVTSIGDYAFYDFLSLTSIDLPNSITDIGEYAFCRCLSLISIDLPNSITNIGEYAFSTCRDLISIDLKDSILSIGEGAFSYCTSLISIELPNTITRIEEKTFQSCDMLTEIIVPSSVTYIGGYAFRFSNKLISIILPTSIETLSNSILYDCASFQCIYYEGSSSQWDEFGVTLWTAPTSLSTYKTGEALEYEIVYNYNG